MSKHPPRATTRALTSSPKPKTDNSTAAEISTASAADLPREQVERGVEVIERLMAEEKAGRKWASGTWYKSFAENVRFTARETEGTLAANLAAREGWSS